MPKSRHISTRIRNLEASHEGLAMNCKYLEDQLRYLRNSYNEIINNFHALLIGMENMPKKNRAAACVPAAPKAARGKCKIINFRNS